MKTRYITILLLSFISLGYANVALTKNELNREDGLSNIGLLDFQIIDTTANLSIKPLYKKAKFKTNKNHTITAEIVNNGKKINEASLSILLPTSWKLITMSKINSLEENEKKTILVSFYIPADALPVRHNIPFNIVDKTKTIKSILLNIKVAQNPHLEISKVFSPENVKAGEMINTTFAIKNKGNIKQDIRLSSVNTIQGNKILQIMPSSTILVDVTQKTNPNINSLININTNLEVTNIVSNKKHKAYSTTTLFPVKIKSKEAYFRFPINTSIFYNSFTNKTDHFSTISTEITGNGYLDLDKKHALSFTFRGPRMDQIRRFGVSDQYSLTYGHKNKTILHLGDQNNNINRLGFTNRFGLGARLDQKIKKWDITAFYIKPRLFDFDSEAVFGAKTVYHITDSISGGVSLVRSKAGNQSYSNKNIENDSDEKGQILTFSLDYRKKSTAIVAESSTSMTNKNVDYANFLRLTQHFKNWSYSGNYTIAGKKYFGTLNNSIQFSNTLNYSSKNWFFSIGQGLYKVNKRLNPLFYAAEPYFQNYFATVNYIINKNHTVNFRLDHRIREDQLEPKNYYYEEHGLNYKYSYQNRSFSTYFNGRIGKTKNLLSNTKTLRNTFSHNLGIAYRFINKLSVRGNINHNYNNRYGKSSNNLNNFRYNLGINFNLNHSLIINANYNSGFSPEETYRKRDFISGSITAKINKNHRLEMRANYFENPGIINQKEILLSAKYIYTLGVPIKKIFVQGGLLGHVITKESAINKKGIRIIAAGNTVISDKLGNFEINNLPLGKNYILVDQSTLPTNVITSVKMPYEVSIVENQKTNLDIKLIQAAFLNGSIMINNSSDTAYNLKGYLKLFNDDFVYYTESDMKGKFTFQQIVPGNYQLALLQLHESNKLLEQGKNIPCTLKEGQTVFTKYNLNLKAQKIRFKNKNFKIGR